MKLTIQKFFGIAALTASATAFANIETANRAWIARDAGERQCYANDAPQIEAVREELNEAGIEPLNIKIDRLKDMLQCSACGCSTGKNLIAKVELTEAVDALVNEGQWRLVNPSQVPGADEVIYHVMPVLTEE